MNTWYEYVYGALLVASFFWFWHIALLTMADGSFFSVGGKRTMVKYQGRADVNISYVKNAGFVIGPFILPVIVWLAFPYWRHVCWPLWIANVILAITATEIFYRACIPQRWEDSSLLFEGLSSKKSRAGKSNFVFMIFQITLGLGFLECPMPFGKRVFIGALYAVFMGLGTAQPNYRAHRSAKKAVIAFVEYAGLVVVATILAGLYWR